MKKEIMKQLLINTNKILFKYNAFVCFGTLLSLTRNNSFFKNDDIDFGIFEYDWQDTIIQEMLDNGFEFKHILGDKNNGFCITFIKDSVGIDISFFYDKKNFFENGAWIPSVNYEWKKPELLLYTITPFNLIKKEFFNNIFYVPDNIEKFLFEIYGNWKVEKKDYKYWLDSPSIRKTGKIFPVRRCL